MLKENCVINYKKSICQFSPSKTFITKNYKIGGFLKMVNLRDKLKGAVEIRFLSCKERQQKRAEESTNLTLNSQ